MIAAIMPCRGRVEQTARNVERLLATAGDVEWRLILVGDDDTPIMPGTSRLLLRQSTYWEALAYATASCVDPLLVSLANDLWACEDWLAHAMAEYQEHFGDSDGLLGFAGDGHPHSHSCHMLISRQLLTRYGGWPVWYRHNFGDRELCARAQADGCYAKSEHAVLEHCHVERGLAPDDAVYQAGRATFRHDEALFVERRRLGWPSV